MLFTNVDCLLWNHSRLSNVRTSENAHRKRAGMATIKLYLSDLKKELQTPTSTLEAFEALQIRQAAWAILRKVYVSKNQPRAAVSLCLKRLAHSDVNLNRRRIRCLNITKIYIPSNAYHHRKAFFKCMHNHNRIKTESLLHSHCYSFTSIHEPLQFALSNAAMNWLFPQPNRPFFLRAIYYSDCTSRILPFQEVRNTIWMLGSLAFRSPAACSISFSFAESFTLWICF